MYYVGAQTKIAGSLRDCTDCPFLLGTSARIASIPPDRATAQEGPEESTGRGGDPRSGARCFGGRGRARRRGDGLARRRVNTRSVRAPTRRRDTTNGRYAVPATELVSPTGKSSDGANGGSVPGRRAPVQQEEGRSRWIQLAQSISADLLFVFTEKTRWKHAKQLPPLTSGNYLVFLPLTRSPKAARFQSLVSLNAQARSKCHASS